ncbi:HWE histidine kinase domain-containing protein [Qipengyuania sp. XHP0211]|uniref:HWE histidine kinase domain-containing protein n=1 Tax=Qipengyuania sp. XHP0211 TaxID=3038079 RepID=UPI00241CB94C|nr:HWE histidine kinase domain-containing protein [Qipengyuania sp. XHP0211]MDG5750358.1 HWE histidine kinase domain-containing protein [Qipengyuania sp. XHP0211]
MKAANYDVDLTNCDREPIHQLGAIQPFGALVALNADWFVSHYSANFGEITGSEKPIELGMALTDIVPPNAMQRLRSLASQVSHSDQVERMFGFDLFGNGEKFDCAIHSTGNYTVLEIEPYLEGELDRQLAALRPVLGRFDKFTDVSALVGEAARQLRHSLDIDRVMVYKFHDDLSGEVVAEAKREDLEGFHGLRYPKSDIPAQARELYVRNRFRIISDVHSEPVPIEPGISLDGEPLDLSMSTLRAVSPIHIEYLKNMGVGASLSISIIIGGKLWGLFACHHYSAKLLPYSQRTGAELFSELFSLTLERVIASQEEAVREEGRKVHDRLMRDIAAGQSLSESLPTIDPLIQRIVEHDGASVFIDDVYNARGSAPNEEEFRAIVGSLNAAATSRVFTTDAIAERIPKAERFADRAVGAMAIPVSRTPRDYLVLWRKPLSQVVTWAGNPEKPVEYGPNGARLTPRKSFEAWQETVEGRSSPWTASEKQIAEGLRVTLLEIILRVTDEAMQERGRAQEKQELLIAELNHRVRNILNLIRGLINQSKGDAKDVDNFAEIVGGRIGSLAMAHDNITKGNWSSAPLSELIDSEAQAYLAGKCDRLEVSGPEAMVTPEAYTVLALVIHEMITNSAKYGSLSDSTGQLKIDVRRGDTGDLEILWHESGGPPVKPPKRRGFGSTIIERSLPYELGGEASIEYKLEGVRARFCVPERFVEWASRGDTPSPTSAVKPQDDGLGHLPERILLVEDSMLIALDTEDCLRDLGVPTVDVESNVTGALETIRKNAPELAILDFNLGQESSERVAQELVKLGIPFWLASGYGEMQDRLEELGAHGVLTKPYGREELSRILSEYEPAA